MHQACMLLTFSPGDRKVTSTVPYSRPSGRRILYTRRSIVLILSGEMTDTFFSEYRRTASVFSSCSGSGALTTARIHCGASAARTLAQDTDIQASAHKVKSSAEPLVARRRATRLQEDLLLICGPYSLVEVAQRKIVFRVHQQDVGAELARNVNGSLLVFRV